MPTAARSGLEAAEGVVDAAGDADRRDRRLDFERVLAVVHRLPPLDRQVLLLWLEDLDAAAIGEVTGLSPAAVATRVHRIRALLAKRLGTRNEARP